MKNINIYYLKTINWLSVIIIILISGCSGGQQFTTFNALSSEAAFTELINRYSSINHFEADAEYKFSINSDDLVSDKMQMTLNGKVSFSRDAGWEIVINGPLGIKLAVLHSNDGAFWLNTPQTGQIREGLLEDGLFIPELEMRLPAISSLDVLFLPTFSLQQSDSWNINNSIQGSTDTFILSREILLDSEKIEITLDYSPLKVHQETYYRNDKIFMKRSLSYLNTKMNIPDSILLEFNGMQVDVNYSSIVLK